ncbi:alcohol dehydrogenase catalytic domain-containing protein [Streptomyces cyaneofuscatus]|uniref:alcohol dehydrogenase catalytic domain-containing protein n=1 Tax=Streptomyces cyaneofuscatus TaxID=66883 RepID=UPI00340519B0
MVSAWGAGSSSALGGLPVDQVGIRSTGRSARPPRRRRARGPAGPPGLGRTAPPRGRHRPPRTDTGTTVRKAAHPCAHLTVKPGRQDCLDVRELPDPSPADGELLVRGLAMGVCGTGREITKGQYGKAPLGRDWLILGHESLGRVERAPSGSGFSAGDLVAHAARSGWAYVERASRPRRIGASASAPAHRRQRIGAGGSRGRGTASPAETQAAFSGVEVTFLDSIAVLDEMGMRSAAAAAQHVAEEEGLSAPLAEQDAQGAFWAARAARGCAAERCSALPGEPAALRAPSSSAPLSRSGLGRGGGSCFQSCNRFQSSL